MSSDEKDPLQSLIADILESENRGQSVDRERVLAEHPGLADSLRDFFASHDRMKAAAAQEGPTLPPDGSGIDDPTIPPKQGNADEATLPPQSDGDDPKLPPTPSPASKGASVGDHVRYFGDYELLEEIARGGMGVVFKARQINLNRIVALKMILAGQFAGQEDVQRFYSEAEAAANLDHSGIVPIFEIGEHEGQHYFSMGYIEGESLAHKVANGPLPPREAAELVKKICDAIAYAHECGVIHRDLKPANILIDKNGQPKVTDFGLAKKTEADSNLTGTGQILGTPAYMPPEQASGKSAQIGPLADVYSLGAILYCLLTGRPPFQAASPMDTLLQVIDREPAPPRLLNPSISINLETIVLKCLAKDPTDRYESTLHLVSDLTAYLEDRAISARRPGLPEKILRFCRKHRRSITVAVSSAAVVSVAVFSAYYLVQSYHASQIGRLSLKSRTKLRAEIIDKRTSETLVDVPVPTTSPIELRAGKYSLRVSSPGLLSDTWPIEIDPSQPQTRELDQTDDVVWETQLPKRVQARRKSITPVNLGELGRNVVLSEIYSQVEYSKSSLQLISGSTGEPIWRFQPADQVLNGVEINRGHYKLTLPCRDLNDDRIHDLLIASRTLPVLTAIDGKSGESLWSFDATSLTQQDDSGREMEGSVLGSPAFCDFDRDGKLDVAACILFQPKGTRSHSRVGESEWLQVEGSSIRICVVSGFTGNLLWKAQIPSQFTQSGRLQIKHSDAACVPIVNQTDDQCVINLVLNGHLHTFTSTESSEPVAIGFDPISPPDIDQQSEPQTADALLFGVEVPEDYKSVMSPTEFSLKLISLQTGATKWKSRLWYPDATTEELVRGKYFDDRFRRIEPYYWVTDLDSDGEREIAVAQMMEDPESGGTRTCIELRRRDSWQLLWQSPKNAIDAETQRLNVRLIVGPDENKDGYQELFVADLVDADDSLALLSVNCLSGKDGTVLWDRQHPLTAGEELQIAALQWQQTGGPSPNLVVSTGAAGSPLDTLFLSSSSGLVERVLPEVFAANSCDFSGDGIDDLLFEHSGTLKLIQVSPPGKWRRLGKWLPHRDLDRDGTTDFVGTEQGRLIARSGVDGEIIWQTGAGDIEVDSLLPPGSLDGVDINDDEVPDVIVLEQIDSDSLRPSEKLCNVTALSGLDGTRLWTVGDIRAILDTRLMGPVIQWTDLDHDLHEELIIASNVSRRIKEPAYTKFERFGLIAHVDARTGAVIWEMKTPEVFVASNRKTLPLFREPKDISGDKVADPVLWLRTDRASVNSGLQLTAINGASGTVLWTAFDSTNATTNDRTPVVADLDADGRADVLVEHDRGHVAALNGQDGNLIWEWRKKDSFLSGPKVARLKNRDHVICLANMEGVHALGQDGQLKWHFATRITGTMNEQWQVSDLDGDGLDELVVPRGKSLIALNASDGSIIWTSTLPGMPDRHAKLTSLAPEGSDGPAITVLWSGKSVFAIDESGKPIWRSEASFHTSTWWREHSSILFSWTKGNPLPGVAVASYARDADVGRTSTIMRQSFPVNMKWEWIGAGNDSVEASTATRHDVGIEATQARTKQTLTDPASGLNGTGFSDWLSVDRFREHFQLMKSRKMRPLELEGRSREGVNEYRVKFDPNSSGISWWARRGISDESYENFQKQYLAQGFTEVWHHAFVDEDGKPIHSAIWEKSLAETQASDRDVSLNPASGEKSPQE